jgi:hypothetical protein
MAMAPGSIRGVHLVARDIDEARRSLIARGVEVGGIDDRGGAVKRVGFSDPEGNSWTLQEMRWRSEDGS